MISFPLPGKLGPVLTCAALMAASTVVVWADDRGVIVIGADGALQKSRVERLTALWHAAKKDGNWSPALALADQIRSAYPADAGLARQVRQLWADCALEHCRQKDYVTARALLNRMEENYVRSPEAKAARDQLRLQAEQLLREAEKSTEAESREKLRGALALWPRLKGARAAWRRSRGEYSVLHVGVDRLPKLLSPATASTDSERQAIELLFEGLVQPRYEPNLGQRYEPRLARRLPEVEPLHRRFPLRPDAYWSDGERVTSSDVRHSAQLILDQQAGRRAMIQPPSIGEESFDCDFPLKQGVFDPLAFLSFKLLPQTYRGKALVRSDDPEFARMPVGSGPYTYEGIEEKEGATLAVFAASSQYVRAPDRNRPYIAEIRFFAWQDPDRDLGRWRNSLLLDVPTEHLAAVKAAGWANIRSLLPRRVYILAVNHRVPILGNVDFRRGLAHAIDREAILDREFRAKHPSLPRLDAIGPALAMSLESQRYAEFHRALNGPYPPDCWAHCPPPRVPASLYDAVLAKTKFRMVQKLGPIKLSLKHPDEARVAAACRILIDQVEHQASSAGLNLHIQAVPLAPPALKHAVENHEYELAYYHVDYENEDYQLSPLFDTQADSLGKGGSNYLGYENDGQLQSLFHTLLCHRRFAAIREATHNIHAHLNVKMPMIPLWHLHYHIAVPEKLDAGYIEPERVFSHVAEWKWSR